MYEETGSVDHVSWINPRRNRNQQAGDERYQWENQPNNFVVPNRFGVLNYQQAAGDGRYEWENQQLCCTKQI